MSRAERLLNLMDVLRQHRRPVAGATLATELGISLRTLYRDIASLQAQGAPIAGEAGLGYQLQAGFFLPPLMFTEEETEALVLGLGFVAQEGDPALVRAARLARSRIVDVLPRQMRDRFYDSGLVVAGAAEEPAEAVDLALVRQAIRDGCKVAIVYRDAEGNSSTRTIWPFGLGYFKQVRMVVAWCEERQDYRHFRADRIEVFEILTERAPRRRAALLKEWRAREGIPAGKLEDC